MNTYRMIFLGSICTGALFLIAFGANAGFRDISEESLFYDATRYAQEEGIVHGYRDGTFHPERKINRADFTKIIINAAFDANDIYGKNCFPDVHEEWFAKYICTAKREGIINGYRDGFFRPYNDISFAEAAKIIERGFDVPVEKGGVEWFAPFVEDLSRQRAIPTSITSIHQRITRGEMAEMIWRLLEGVQEKPFAEYENGKLVAQPATPIEDFENDYFYDEQENDDADNSLQVYEVEVAGPEECSSLEEYDPENSTCFFECSSEEECQSIMDEIDAELSQWADDYGDFSQQFEEHPQQGGEAVETGNAEAIYKIETGENFVLVSGNENENHKKIKKWLAVTSPDKFSDTYLARLVFLPKTDDGSLAFVTPNEENKEKWDMFIGMDSLKKYGEKEMVFTVIHEFTHILTLNSAQITSDIPESQCSTFFTQEGCTQSHSYLHQFVQRFWEGKFDTKSGNAEDNYTKHPDAFVTEYAATNPGEDIAESFSAFVLQKKPESAKTVAQQKLLFFYQYPELVKIRDSIRNELHSFVRSRKQ